MSQSMNEKKGEKMASARTSVMNRTRLLPVVITMATSMSAVDPASADVVGPMPLECPPGTTRTRGHGQSYCKPEPPTNCPPGYEGKVIGPTAFCEPPPPRPCPPGSQWETWKAGEPGVCAALPRCGGPFPRPDQCLRYGEHATCEETSYCIRPDSPWRSERAVVLEACTTDADCDPFKCEKQKRCVSPDIQSQEAARIEAAKVLRPVPPMYSTESETVRPEPIARTNTAPTTSTLPDRGDGRPRLKEPTTTVPSTTPSDPSSQSSTNHCACRMVGSDRGSGHGVVLVGWACAWAIRRRARAL